MLAQTIRKNMYVPYEVLEIIFGVTIYQKWEIFGFLFFPDFLFFSFSNQTASDYMQFACVTKKNNALANI